MKLPRYLKGSDPAKTLCRDWAYRVVHQEGTPKMHHLSSHIFHDGLEKLSERPRRAETAHWASDRTGSRLNETFLASW
jgi:hypothetical protein